MMERKQGQFTRDGRRERGRGGRQWKVEKEGENGNGHGAMGGREGDNREQGRKG